MVFEAANNKPTSINRVESLSHLANERKSEAKLLTKEKVPTHPPTLEGTFALNVKKQSRKMKTKLLLHVSDQLPVVRPKGGSMPLGAPTPQVVAGSMSSSVDPRFKLGQIDESSFRTDGGGRRR